MFGDGEKGTVDFSGIRVLVADDDLVIRETLVESLLTMGFKEITTAGDGQETLECLNRSETDLLLLDLAMPRVRGEEVVEIALAQNSALVIIVITGFATLDKAVDLMKKGIYDLIRKPFHYSILARKIEAAIEKSRARKAERAGERDFGEFLLVEEISRGGAGVVWKAVEKETGDAVALKVLLAGEKATDEQILRFHREAATIAELRHPNIVAIRRIGAFKGQHFIAMDFIDGLPLDEWIERKNPGLRTILGVIAQVGRTLYYAHGREILHRDLKPSNILVDGRQTPHIIDFGLAKSIRDNLRITRKSRLHGTIGYIAPERFHDRGGEEDLRTDLFSLGVILYEILESRLPYPMFQDGQLLPDFSCPPALPRPRPGMPGELPAIALRAVAVRPEDRFGDALEFVRAIERCLENPSQG
jgi:FixJ family two-component response regulator